MRFLHVTIHTNKFEQEIAFYGEVLGLPMTKDLRRFGQPIVFFGEAGCAEVEIIKNDAADNEGNGNLSIGFEASDMEGLRERLIAEGCMVTPVISPMPGIQFVFTTDPAGVKVQIMRK